jgi:hypothetical protein
MWGRLALVVWKGRGVAKDKSQEVCLEIKSPDSTPFALTGEPLIVMCGGSSRKSGSWKASKDSVFVNGFLKFFKVHVGNG